MTEQTKEFMKLLLLHPELEEKVYEILTQNKEDAEK